VPDVTALRLLGYEPRIATQPPPAMHNALQPNRQNSYFGRPFPSFFALSLLFAFAALLVAALYPRSGSSGAQARHTAAVYQIDHFKTTLERFRRNTGFYPKGTNGLLDLVNQPAAVTNWIGPYLPELPHDPWGRDYVYACPGKHTAYGYPYDLYSLGPPDKNAVIANWAFENMKP